MFVFTYMGGAHEECHEAIAVCHALMFSNRLFSFFNTHLWPTKLISFLGNGL